MHVLEEGPFPILAWIGPCQEQITPKTMADLATGGFNLSLSNLTPDRMVEQLDMARDAGVRLVIGLPDLRVAPGTVDDAWERKMKEVVAKVRDHKGLYGYYIADEPKIDRYEDMAKAFRILRRNDPEHLCYCNHWTVNMSWGGFRSYEEMWNRYGEMCRPSFVSADLYPFHVCDAAEWAANQPSPYYFPRHKARMERHYFEMLEITRQYALRWNVPMWNFTFSVPRYSSETAEGEMRFQLMMALAYGAKGLQYFSYSHGGMMIDADLEPTASWHLAKKLNAEIRRWEPTLRKLQSIGVYHWPSDVAYTRPLDQYKLGNPDDLVCRGDPAVIGQFIDDEGWEYVLIVNRTPFEPSSVNFHFGTDDEVLECDPGSGEWRRPWPYRTREMPLTFTPGQGRLFRFRRNIKISEVYGI